MKDVYVPDSYYEPEAYDDKLSDVEEFIYQGQGFLEDVVKQLYSKKTLDISHLEFCLDELCHMFNIRGYQDPIQIQRKPNNIEDMTRFFKKETQEFQLAKRG